LPNRSADATLPTSITLPPPHAITISAPPLAGERKNVVFRPDGDSGSVPGFGVLAQVVWDEHRVHGRSVPRAPPRSGAAFQGDEARFGALALWDQGLATPDQLRLVAWRPESDSNRLERTRDAANSSKGLEVGPLLEELAP
jgi:hypothetical protein